MHLHVYDRGAFNECYIRSYCSLSVVIPGHGAFLAIANIVFAYAGHVAFFTFFSELKDLKDYPKSLALLQFSEMVLYTVSAIVIYVFVGPEVASPALNSAGPLVRKITYGLLFQRYVSCKSLSLSLNGGVQHY